MCYNTLKESAHKKISSLRASGGIQKKPCEICGFQRYTVAHHEDYSKPLDIMWLCAVCHKLRHQQIDTPVDHCPPVFDVSPDLFVQRRDGDRVGCHKMICPFCYKRVSAKKLRSGDKYYMVMHRKPRQRKDYLSIQETSKILSALLSSGWTQVAIATRLNVSQAAVARWRAGYSGAPSGLYKLLSPATGRRNDNTGDL